eukprot:Skav223041  [mRNA]  locus=scaffold1069:138252:139415:+ [translate_table: standard]
MRSISLQTVAQRSQRSRRSGSVLGLLCRPTCIAILVSMGGLPGFSQTTFRAELFALVSAFEFALRGKREFYIWTDNQAVWKGITHFSRQCANTPNTDHDLWERLYRLWCVTTDLALPFRIIKVRSHEDPAAYTEVVDRWVIRGNDAADEWANHARSQLPRGLQQAWAQARKDHAQQTNDHAIIHEVLCQVGLRAVETKPTRRESDECDWETVERPAGVEQQLSFVPLPTAVPEGCGGALGTNASRLLSWLTQLTQAPGAQPRWLTSYELLAHYQITTGHVGYWYNGATKAFEDATEVYRHRGFDFLKLAAWFQSALKALATVLESTYLPISLLPHSSIFRCWTRCLLLGINPEEHKQVEAKLTASHNGRIQSVRKAFGARPPFILSA